MSAPAPVEDQRAAPDAVQAPPRRRRRPRRQWVRRGVTLVVLGVGACVIVQKATDMHVALDRVGAADWRWLLLAVGFEAASMVVFARLQRWLLRAGGVTVPLRDMTELTVAGNAMAATLPGGVAWSAAWVFDQLRRRGVDRFLRVWVFLVAGAVSSFALFIVVAVGVEVAGSRGPVAGLRLAVAALAGVPVVGLVLWWLRSTALVCRGIDRARAAAGRVAAGRWVLDRVDDLVRRIRAVTLSPFGWVEVLGLGLLNWVDDCAVLVLSLVALHVDVPWRGIFVVYGITQIAAVVPITPGGLGVVEGSLIALLTAYGVPAQQALAVTILYRLISFWGLVPIGWGFWLVLDLGSRRRWRRGRAHPWAEHYHGSSAAEKRPGAWATPTPCTGACEGFDEAEALATWPPAVLVEPAGAVGTGRVPPDDGRVAGRDTGGG